MHAPSAEVAAGDDLDVRFEPISEEESLAPAIDSAADSALPVKETAGGAIAHNVEAARRAYHEAEKAAEHASQSLTSSYTAAVKGFAEINAKAMDAWRTNAISALQFVEALMGSRSLAEAIELQARHAREQFEVVSGQAKDLAALARKVASETAEPLQSRLPHRAEAGGPDR